MTARKEGPLTRLAKRLGLGKTTGGGSGIDDCCWSCDVGKCGIGFDRTCSCCRAGHTVR